MLIALDTCNVSQLSVTFLNAHNDLFSLKLFDNLDKIQDSRFKYIYSSNLHDFNMD